MNCGRSACNFASPMNLVCHQKRRRPSPSLCSPTKPGTTGPRTYPLPPARNAPPSWGRFPMPDRGATRTAMRLGLLLLLMVSLLACSPKPDHDTLVMLIENSPTNLDPRVGLDAQSERIDDLIFDDLLSRDEHLNVQPQLADRWDIPDPLTYVFHLHHGVKFHDGRPLTSRDVKWTFDSLLQEIGRAHV